LRVAELGFVLPSLCAKLAKAWRPIALSGHRALPKK
jgi:hypothetical protein